MTEQPDPTRELDLSELAEEPAEESAAKEEDAVAGEPGWEATEDDTPSEDAQ